MGVRKSSSHHPLWGAFIFLALIAPAFSSSFAAAQPQRIGFVDPQRVVDSTRLGRKAKADLARFIAEKDRMARDGAAELAALRRAAEVPGLSAQERATREEAYRRKALEHQLLLRENERDVKSEEAKLLRYVMRRADDVLRDIGRKGGYAVILIDPNAVGYVDKTNVDLTERVARELNSRGK